MVWSYFTKFYTDLRPVAIYFKTKKGFERTWDPSEQHMCLCQLSRNMQHTLQNSLWLFQVTDCQIVEQHSDLKDAIHNGNLNGFISERL